MAVSGTGCFTGIKGGLAITAQSIEADYDYFSYEVKSTNEASGAIEPTDSDDTTSDSGAETGTETGTEIGTGDSGTEGIDSAVDAGTGNEPEETSGNGFAENPSHMLHLKACLSFVSVVAAIFFS